MEEWLREVKCYESPSTGSLTMEGLSVELQERGMTPFCCLTEMVSLMCLLYRHFYGAQLLWCDAGGTILGGSLSVQADPRKR